MAGIGLYGVYYAKATITSGVLSGYGGVKTMGKAIQATFAPTAGSDNQLWANNAIAEVDGAVSQGGELTLTLDQLKAAAQEDLFGLTATTATVTVGTATVSGSGFDYTGNEQANVVGVAFIRQAQIENDRNYHEAVIFSYATFQEPQLDAQTIGSDGITWQTPQLTGTISGAGVTGSYPWAKKYTFPTQAAAEKFIENYFAAQ